jgi:hypothetical protein
MSGDKPSQDWSSDYPSHEVQQKVAGVNAEQARKQAGNQSNLAGRD